MIWVTWRQFRTQAVVALGALVVAAVILVITGTHLADLYNTSGLATCKTHGDCGGLEHVFLSHYKLLRDLLGPALLAVPALLGMFWGAPLLARELESGTYRLAWTQSITRTRWLAVKVALIGLASVAVAELFSLMVTWWFRPIDRVNMNRLTPGVFDERDIVTIGYAAFAFALGLAAGALIRRTVPAMATTLIAFVGSRLAITYLVRPHLTAPDHASTTLSSAGNLVGFDQGPSGVALFVAGNPNLRTGAWVYSTTIVDKAGQAPAPNFVHSVLSSACPSITAPGVGPGPFREPSRPASHGYPPSCT
jgi:hypothetical protein